MLKKKRLSTRPISEMNVVPYIDVMLVLLVIFMITAPMLTQGISVELPKAQSEAVTFSEKEPIIVSVSQQGDLFLNLSQTPDNPIEPHALMVRVAAELALAEQTSQTLQVLVKGDNAVHYGKVVQAMSLLKQAGAAQVGLITDGQEDAKNVR